MKRYIKRSGDLWCEEVLRTTNLEELCFKISLRSVDYPTNGPPLDCLSHDLPEKIFIELARDELFRDRLVEALRHYLKGTYGPDVLDFRFGVSRSVVSLVGQLQEAELIPELKRWFLREAERLLRDHMHVVGRNALNVLIQLGATGPEHYGWWFRVWEQPSIAWQTTVVRAFARSNPFVAFNFLKVWLRLVRCEEQRLRALEKDLREKGVKNFQANRSLRGHVRSVWHDPACSTLVRHLLEHRDEEVSAEIFIGILRRHLNHEERRALADLLLEI
jgi:hypothetical protein